jgi:hypothetical protein
MGLLSRVVAVASVARGRDIFSERRGSSSIAHQGIGFLKGRERVDTP